LQHSGFQQLTNPFFLSIFPPEALIGKGFGEIELMGCHLTETHPLSAWKSIANFGENGGLPSQKKTPITGGLRRKEKIYRNNGVAM
jgi:hypothetical protein